MKKPTILYITELFPLPPDSGAKIKSINTIQTLSKKFNIVLISFSDQSVAKKDLNSISKFVVKTKIFTLKNLNQPPQNNLQLLLANYLNLKPYFLFQFASPVAQKYIAELIKKIKPMAIHIDHLNMAQYLPTKKNELWILEEHNLEHQLAGDRFWHFPEFKKTKLFLGCEFLLTLLYELKTWQKFDHIFAISNQDRQVISWVIDKKKVTTQPIVYKKIKTAKKLTNKPQLLFVGDLTWHPNVLAITWFIDKIWPMILEKEPTAFINLVGKIEPELKIKLEQQPGVKVWNYQNQLSKFFADAQVFVLPFLSGSGVRVKALTAMAHRLPIVATTKGILGLEGIPGKDYLVSDRAREFAEHCLKLISNHSLANKVINSGEKYLWRHHSPKNNQQFLKNYLSLFKHL